jgi:hypothetical protein
MEESSLVFLIPIVLTAIAGACLSMKVIGIIGGMSRESSAEYYLLIN